MIRGDRQLGTVALAFGIALGLAQPAAAEMITLRFQASITDVSAGLQGQFGLGATAAWSLTYDTTLAEDPSAGNLADPRFGGYGQAAFNGWGGSFDGYSVGTGGSRFTFVSDADGTTPWQYDTVSWNLNYYGLSSHLAGPPLSVGNLSVRPWAFFSSVQFDPATFNSDRLPALLGPALGGRFSLYFNDDLETTVESVRGQITSVDRIPEPGTLALALAGLAVGGAAWRRRATRQGAPARTPDRSA